MPTPVDERAHLCAANDHLRLAVFLLSAQEDRMAREMAAGPGTEVSGELFFTMQTVFRTFLAHRQMILEALNGER